MKAICGKVFSAKAILLRVPVGEAKAEFCGKNYTFELCIHGGQNTPIVQCKETGNFFALSWQDILDLAGAAGITKAGEV